MKDLNYVFENFFTHKDYLVSAELIPGTIYTPLHIAFVIVLLAIILSGVAYVCKRRHLIKPVFTAIWVVRVIWEFVIIYWESTTGKTPGLDLTSNLSLYPCSIFLYTMPFAIWGKGISQKIAYGYLCTLGMMGALINFVYPVSRLTIYSCISFPGFHTFFFHGAMLFVFLVIIKTKMHTYHAETVLDLFLPCIASVIVSIPANIVNYSPIHADYMYFTGQFPLVAMVFGDTPAPVVTFVLYMLYIFVPALFYLPSFLKERKNHKNDKYFIEETSKMTTV